MSQQAPVAIRDLSFGGAYASAPAQHHAFCPDLPRLGCDWPDKRNLKFQCGLTDTFVEGRLDSEPHAAIKQSRGEAAMHRASRVEQGIIRLRDNDDTPVLGFDYVVTKCACDSVEGQGSVSETLNKLKAAHFFLPVRTDGSINSGCSRGHRCLLPLCQDWPRRSPGRWPSASCYHQPMRFGPGLSEGHTSTVVAHLKNHETKKLRCLYLIFLSNPLIFTGIVQQGIL